MLLLDHFFPYFSMAAQVTQDAPFFSLPRKDVPFRLSVKAASAAAKRRAFLLLHGGCIHLTVLVYFNMVKQIEICENAGLSGKACR